MKQQWIQACSTASWLLWSDIRVFLHDWFQNFLDALCWPVVLILANGYVLPTMGMSADYGAFIAISMLIIMASFTAWTAANSLAADLEGPRSISYELTLPLPYWLVCVKTIVAFGCKAALFNVMSLIVGKVILLDAFSLAHANVLKFFIIYLMSCLFFGSFAFWAAVFAGTIKRFMAIELRVAGPLFFICGYSFSWKTLYAISPMTALGSLIAPWWYAYEGVRAALLGQPGYINFYTCLGMLFLFCLAFSLWGIYLFKKRMDCI